MILFYLKIDYFKIKCIIKLFTYMFLSMLFIKTSKLIFMNFSLKKKSGMSTKMI
jgi:hypothetical protein